MWGKKGELEIWLTLRSFRTLSEGIKKFFKILSFWRLQQLYLNQMLTFIRVLHI